MMLGMETLSKLFGSETKVKMMRLFLFNPETVFVTKDIAERAKSDIAKVRRELSNIEKTGLIKKKVSRGGKGGFILDHQFLYLTPLQNFLINVEPLNPKEIIKRIGKLGNIKLILIAGVFIKEPESRLDLLIVGDGVKKAALEKIIKTLESEIGKELKYAQFTSEDFKYRLSMCDKLTRDILDYPHRKIVNRFGIL
ncbi:MAG: putative transcriptional regulator [Parcubacteria group bacterium GW2011_GWA2_40_14]|nr:MAG: putative transcriptional regulator [Parcubacteria group bacterium GW2011_GWA2_40_14]